MMNNIKYSLLLLSLIFGNLSAHKPALDNTIYDGWKSLSSQIISEDGKWVTYTINPQQGDGWLYIYNVASGKIDSVARGGHAVFSPDHMYLAYQYKLDIWSYDDDVLQPMQKKQLEQDRKRTWQAVYHINKGIMFQLADTVIPIVRTFQKGNSTLALGSSDLKYQKSSWDGGASRNLTSSIKLPFYDELNDVPDDPAPHGIAGWMDDEKHILVYDRYDIWSLDLTGVEGAVNITNSFGRTNNLRLRYNKLDPEAEFVSKKDLMFLSSFNYENKESGFFTLKPGKPSDPNKLLMEKASFPGELAKAKNTDGLYSYMPPAPSASIINRIFAVSNGYLVFVPDIPYVIGYPGQSCYNAVVSGTYELLNKYTFIDKDKLALDGQSWGGYQIAYLVTQTDLFACAYAGAAVSNMISAYGGIRWGTGMSRMFQYEHTQSRIGGTLWENPLQFIENSPIFWVPKINTPLLLMHNDSDGAVPWYQSIEFFTALRRLNKPAWLLSYNDEDHNLVKRPNRKDISIRKMQFFDHYLKGLPMPY